jgi:hypothetical protein
METLTSMKTVLLSLFLIYAPASFCQYRNLKIESSQVIFEHVYPVDSLDAAKVKSLLISAVPQFKDVTDIDVHDEIITAKIKNAEVDFKKYGGKWASTPTYLLHPMNANVSFYWKDGKYRVLITNVEFLMPWFGNKEEPFQLTMLLTKKNEFQQGKNITKGGAFLDRYLEDWFTVQKQSDW